MSFCFVCTLCSHFCKKIMINIEEKKCDYFPIFVSFDHLLDFALYNGFIQLEASAFMSYDA